jgi:hypothetical protein
MKKKEKEGQYGQAFKENLFKMSKEQLVNLVFRYHINYLAKMTKSELKEKLLLNDIDIYELNISLKEEIKNL